MAFRRSRNFSRSNFRSRSRFRPRATDRKARPTQVWEWGEFHTEITENLPDTSPATTLRFIRLATTRTISDASTGPGVAAISAMHHIDVGGVVMDYGVRAVTDIDADAGVQTGLMFCMVGLVVDRMDGDAIPTSLASWDPFLSSTPVATASIAGGTPLGNTLDIDRPTRMLWQKTWALDFGTRQIINDTAGELYVPNGQLVDTRHSTLNKRLRLRLSDELGLYVVFAYRPSIDFATGQVPLATEWLRGSIYYRYAF